MNVIKLIFFAHCFNYRASQSGHAKMDAPSATDLEYSSQVQSLFIRSNYGLVKR